MGRALEDMKEGVYGRGGKTRLKRKERISSCRAYMSC